MRWLNSLRLDDGSFMMHADDGEVDIRGVYCALSVARLTNVFTHGKTYLDFSNINFLPFFLESFGLNMLKVIAMATRFQDFRNKKMKYVLKKNIN
jgi:hypothetical protein